MFVYYAAVHDCMSRGPPQHQPKPGEAVKTAARLTEAQLVPSRLKVHLLALLLLRGILWCLRASPVGPWQAPRYPRKSHLTMGEVQDCIGDKADSHQHCDPYFRV